MDPKLFGATGDLLRQENENSFFFKGQDCHSKESNPRLSTCEFYDPEVHS